MGFVATLKVVGPEFVVRDIVFENVICRRQDECGHGQDCLLGSAPALEAKKLGPEVRVARAGRHPGDLDEGSFEPRVAGSRAL